MLDSYSQSRMAVWVSALFIPKHAKSVLSSREEEPFNLNPKNEVIHSLLNCSGLEG